MKQQIKHRYSDKVLFECELDDNTVNPMREAVIRAVASKADLSEADLSFANLSKANLSEANLSEANLSKANLSKANLSEANLSFANLSKADLSKAAFNPIKADFWMVLLSAPFEIVGLRSALIEGRVDGSTYEGDCACLVGTIANVRHADYQQIGIKPDSSRAAERWFMGIKKGDTPETNQISKITVEWLDEFTSKLAFASGKTA
jgi:hypothetical protein